MSSVVTAEADSLVSQASHLHAAGRTAEALVRVETALGLEPANVFALLLRAHIAVEQRDAIAALPRLRAVLSLQPNCAPALADLAQALWLAGQPRDGLDPARRAVVLNPTHAGYRLNLAQLCVWLGRHDEAQATVAPLLEEPWHPPQVRARARGMHAVDLVFRGRFEEADTAFVAALADAPDAKALVRAYGLNLLRLGRLSEGWPLVSEPVPMPGQPWQGENLAGRTILLRDNQGLGDAIQMLRYLPMLQAREPGRVVWFTLPALRRLFAAAAPWVEFVDTISSELHVDVHCLTMDLPWRFGTTLATIPAAVPYLPALPAPRLGPGLHVGLVWSGNPRNLNDLRRSIPARDLLGALAGIPGVHFHALQTDVRATDRAALEAHPEVDHPGARVADFAETAAIVAQLDLVVTVDTSVAHLAGALGRPVWVLLPEASDWRWLTRREDSPWYPTMRLFRAGESGWKPVMRRVAAALRRFAKG